MTAGQACFQAAPHPALCPELASWAPRAGPVWACAFCLTLTLSEWLTRSPLDSAPTGALDVFALGSGSPAGSLERFGGLAPQVLLSLEEASWESGQPHDKAAAVGTPWLKLERAALSGSNVTQRCSGRHWGGRGCAVEALGSTGRQCRPRTSPMDPHRHGDVGDVTPGGDASGQPPASSL